MQSETIRSTSYILTAAKIFAVLLTAKIKWNKVVRA